MKENGIDAGYKSDKNIYFISVRNKKRYLIM